LVKELQSQGLLQMMQFAGNPEVAGMMKWQNMLRMTSKSLYVDPKEVVKDDDTIAKEMEEAQAAASEQPQTSPDVQAKIDASMQVAEMNAAGKEDEMEFKYAQMERQTEELMAQLAQEQNLTLEDIEAKYNISLEAQSLDATKFFTELNFKKETGKPGI